MPTRTLALATSLDVDSAAQVEQWGRRPVIGICAFNDDIPTARLAAPPLTTVSFSMRNVVARRAEAVVAELSGTPAGTARTSLDPQLVQRTST